MKDKSIKVLITKVLKIAYLLFATLILIGMIMSIPEFNSSTKDILIYRISNGLFAFFMLVLPGILIIYDPIREKVPLFRKRKIWSTTLGWFILFVIGLIAYGIVDSMYTEVYKAERESLKIQVIESKETDTVIGDIQQEKSQDNNIPRDTLQDNNIILETQQDNNEEDMIVVPHNVVKSEDNIESKGNIIIKGLDDEIISMNVAEACKEIGLDISKIKRLKLNGSWFGGDRYHFTYEGNGVEIYMNGDDTVSSINVGDVKVYEKGFEPLDISDYILQIGENIELQLLAEKTVKNTLNYPETAKFSFLDWGYGRAKNIYMVSGLVTAKNAFGVKSKMDFYIEYNKSDSLISTEKFVLDGQVLLDSGKPSIETDKAQVYTEADYTNENEGIELVYGTLDKYGEEITENGNSYIVYNIPAGTYRVSTSMNYCVVIIEKKDFYINSTGFIEHEVSMKQLSKDESIEITLMDDERVTLMVNAKVLFQLIN